MQLSFNPKTPNFKAFYITQSGENAIEEFDKYNRAELEVPFSTYIYRQQKKRENDKYIDTIITGTPDQLGYYCPVLHIHDKVTGKHYTGKFSVDTPLLHSDNTCKTKSGENVDKNSVIATDANNKEMVINFNSGVEATDFTIDIKYDRKDDYLQFAFADAIENHYRLSNHEEKPDKYDELTQKFQKAYGKSMHKVVPEVLAGDNLIGKGRHKNVYKLDKLPEYVLCVVRDEYNPRKPIDSFYPCPKTYNVRNGDEPIMVNDNGMYIKKYTKGVSHSIPNWADKFHGIEALTYDDVECFKSKLEDLSSFPTKSYVNFAKELQQMNRTRIRMDTINPNNIIVNSDTQTISVIDTESTNTPLSLLWDPVNSLSDMEAVLLDSVMYMTYYNMATDEDKEKLDEYSKQIIKKCGYAAKVSNIGNFTENTLTYARNIDNKMPLEQGPSRKERIESFMEHFSDVLSSGIDSKNYYIDKFGFVL